MARVLTHQSPSTCIEVLGSRAELIAPCRLDAKTQLVDTLLPPAKSIAQARGRCVDLHPSEPFSRSNELIAAKHGLQSMPESLDQLRDLVLGLGDELRCRRRRGRAQVCDEIRNREVRFVANR